MKLEWSKYELLWYRVFFIVMVIAFLLNLIDQDWETVIWIGVSLTAYLRLLEVGVPRKENKRAHD